MPDEDERGDYETIDLVDLPEGYGRGTPALFEWVQSKLSKDRKKGGHGGRRDDGPQRRGITQKRQPSGVSRPFPRHWGRAPDKGAYDGYDSDEWVDLPGGYGRGPPPLAKWVGRKLDQDRSSGSTAARAGDSDEFGGYDMNDWYTPPTVKGNIEVAAADITRSLPGTGGDVRREQEAMVERIRQSIRRCVVL